MKKTDEWELQNDRSKARKLTNETPRRRVALTTNVKPRVSPGKVPEIATDVRKCTRRLLICLLLPTVCQPEKAETLRSLPRCQNRLNEVRQVESQYDFHLWVPTSTMGRGE
jgi:hypothetical protein